MAKGGMKLVGDWAKSQKILAAAPADLKQAMAKALLQEALYLLNELRKNFKKVAPPNAASTIKQKGSSKPLVNHRDLYNAMQITPTNPKDEVFIGIPAATKARGGKGAALVKLIDIHENGKIIIQHMTDKQRRFLHAMLGNKGQHGGGSGGIIIIHIPARPFIRPTFEENTPDKIAHRFLERLTSNLKVIPHK